LVFTVKKLSSSTGLGQHENNTIQDFESQVTTLVLVQGYPFFALAEIDHPVGNRLQYGKQIVAGNQDHYARVSKGMGGEPVIPLGEILAILFLEFAVPAFCRTHGAQLQHIIAYAVTNDEVKKQYQNVHSYIWCDRILQSIS